MATLRAVLERMFARPNSEAPEWVLLAKRSNRTVESIDVEFRASRHLRSWSAPLVCTRRAVPIPVVANARKVTPDARRRIDRQNQLRLEYMADQIRLAEIREADPKTLRVKLVNGKYHRDYLAEQWDADRRAQEEREHPKSTRLSCESDTWLR
jgi:hypothetical protein